MSEHDSRNRRPSDPTQAAERPPSRAGAGPAASRVFRREARSTELAAGSLPFMDMAIRSAAVLRKEDAQATGAAASNDDASAIAAQGVSGSTGSLPHAAKMQSAFKGTLDLSTVNVHQGPEAADASAQLGAQAYAFGSSIALPQGADEFTTARARSRCAGTAGKGSTARCLEPR